MQTLNAYSYAPSRPWFRAVVVAMVALFVLTGSAQAVTTLNADIDTSGNLAVDGNTVLGDGGADTFTFSGSTFAATSASTVSFDGGEGSAFDLGSGYTLDGGEGVGTLHADTSNTISAGGIPPDAGEAFGDVAVEATGSFLVETTGLADFDIGGDFNVDTDFFGLTATDAGVAFDLNAAAGGLDADLELDITMTSDDGDIIFTVADGSAGDDENIVLISGDAAPDAGENGNDVVIEAQDDVLIETGGSFVADAANGPVTIDGELMTIDFDAGEGSLVFSEDGTVRARVSPSGFTIGATGSAIDAHYSGTATNLVSASISGVTCGNYGTITVTGAAVGDTVYASPDAGSSASGIEDSNLMWNAVVTSADTVTIRACNPTALAIDAGDDQEWRADVLNH